MDGGTPRRLIRNGAEQRRALILGRLRDLGHVQVSALSAEFGVSEMTIRRDLRQLSEEGLARLVHGGARMARSAVPVAYGARAAENAAAKRRIGAAVAADLPAGGVVGYDAGTTVVEVAAQLRADTTGTAVTHSVPVLSTLIAFPQIHTIGIGGDLNAHNQAMLGPRAESVLAELRLDTFILGASAADRLGVYVNASVDLGMKRSYMEVAASVVLAMDVAKFAAPGAIRVCGWDRINVLVTSGPVPAELAAVIDAAGCRIVVVD